MHQFSPEERELLNSARVARLATADLEHPPRPHCVPVCYALHEGKLWVALDEKPKSGRKLRRLRNIEANPNVCLTIDHYEDDWSRLAYLLVEATATLEPLPDGARGALTERYPQYRAMHLTQAIAITPHHAVLWRATR